MAPCSCRSCCEGCCSILCCNFGAWFISCVVGPCYCIEHLNKRERDGGNMDMEKAKKVPGAILGTMCGCPLCFICWAVYFVAVGFEGVEVDEL